MKNGYALPSRGTSIQELAKVIEDGGIDLKQNLTNLLRVGVHWDTEVDTTTLPLSSGEDNDSNHRVSQVYCSALPIGYDNSLSSLKDWEPFARVVLDGTYEATLAVGAILAKQRNNQRRIKVYLTKVGGGVFGNPSEWIIDSIQRSLAKFQNEPLDVYLVHYGQIEYAYKKSLTPIVVSEEETGTTKLDF